MANERTTREPLTATVGERIGDRAREGDAAGVERAREVVDDLRGAGYEPEPREREGETGAGSGARPGARAGGARGTRAFWAVAAGLGAWVVVGMIGRALRR